MEDGQGLSATWGANPDLPHRGREGGDLSFTEGQESPRHVFPQELSHLNGTFLGSTSCWSYVTLVSVVTTCASASERIPSSSSNSIEIGSFSFFRNISCVLSWKRHSSGKSPVAHLVVRTSSLLWPAPANETWRPSALANHQWKQERSLATASHEAMKRCLFCFVLAPSSRSVPICIFHRPRRFAPHRRTPHRWDEFPCPSSVG